MSELWWLRPGWKDALCAKCGVRIWPEGDPDHGVCYDCFMAAQREHSQRSPLCDICGQYEAVTGGSGGTGVCSQACYDEATRRHNETVARRTAEG